MAVGKRCVERLRGHVEMLDVKLAESLGQESPSFYRYLQLVIGFLAMCLDDTEESQELLRFYMVTGSAGAASTPVGQSCKSGVAGSSTTPMHAVEVPRTPKESSLGARGAGSAEAPTAKAQADGVKAQTPQAHVAVGIAKAPTRGQTAAPLL